MLGRHRVREGKLECTWCGADYECHSCVVGGSVQLIYSSSRASFMVRLEELLGDTYRY